MEFKPFFKQEGGNRDLEECTPRCAFSGNGGMLSSCGSGVRREQKRRVNDLLMERGTLDIEKPEDVVMARPKGREVELSKATVEVGPSEVASSPVTREPDWQGGPNLIIEAEGRGGGGKTLGETLSAKVLPQK